MTKEHFGRRLRALRIERGYTSQIQFAEHLGIAPKTVCRHELSAKPPRAIGRVLQAYLQLLDVDEDYFLHGIGNPPPVTRAAGRRVPPNVARVIQSLTKGNPVHDAVAKGLLAVDWVGLGNADPTEWQVRNFANMLEGWHQK